MIRTVLSILLGASVLAATPALAEYEVSDRFGSGERYHPDYRNEPIRVEIVDDRGQRLTQYPLARQRKRDTYRAYLAARQGTSYTIRVENRSPFRVGLVIAVDGRNILSGERSDLQPDERMYVLGPHERGAYRGWRTGRDRVNEFYFTDAPDSYAGRWGDYSAMGVIAVAAYREQQRLTPYGGGYGAEGPRKQAPAAPRGDGQARSEPGTGYGDERYDPSRQVRFTPERQPLARVFLKYEWPETLCERGIGACGSPDNRFWDEPTRYRQDDNFAAPPPSRRRRW